MYERKFVLWGSAIVIGTIALCAYFFVLKTATSRYITTDRTLSIAGVGVAVAVADTPNEREQGLSGTTGLSQSEGMFFIFDRDDQHSFWMKDMAYAIDIIWISAGKRVVYIEKGVAPDTFPHAFTPPTPARYVLEVPAGFSSAHGIKVGSEVAF